MGKVLCFIYDDMADFELILASHFVARHTGREIVPIAYESKVIKSAAGMSYYPMVTVKEALEYTDIEGIIIPGGWNRVQKEELTEILIKVNNEGKLLASICAGPEYLARAGVLDGRKYTTTLTEAAIAEMGIEDSFPRETFLSQNVVRDGNIITATGNAFVDFAIEIADWFGIFKDEEDKREAAMHFKGL